MTEQEWLNSNDPQRMLDWLVPKEGRNPHQTRANLISDRKLRLFACAVARLQVPGCDVSCVEACVEANQPNHNFNDVDSHRRGEFWAVCKSIDAAVLACTQFPTPMTAALLREVRGNPLRPVPMWKFCPGDPVGWATLTVRSIAQRAYDERGRKCTSCNGLGCAYGPKIHALGCKCCTTCHGTGRVEDGSLDPDTLAVLADALEDAGCDNEDVLNHCRQPGIHVRGCWVLDLLLGKE